MTVKIKMRTNKMAVVKFTNPIDQQYFTHMMLMARDNKQPHPQISIRNTDNNEMPPIKPPTQKPGVQIPPKKLTPEMMAQLKKQGMPMPPVPIGKEPQLVKPEDVKINVEEKPKSDSKPKS